MPEPQAQIVIHSAEKALQVSKEQLQAGVTVLVSIGMHFRSRDATLLHDQLDAMMQNYPKSLFILVHGSLDRLDLLDVHSLEALRDSADAALRARGVFTAVHSKDQLPLPLDTPPDA